jgi:hypothetical protein
MKLRDMDYEDGTRIEMTQDHAAVLVVFGFCQEKLNSSVLAKLRVSNKAPNLELEHVTMCCLVRTTVHLRDGGINMEQ